VGSDHRLGSAVVALESLLEVALHVDVEASAPIDRRWGDAVKALAKDLDSGAADRPQPLDTTSLDGDEILRRAIAELPSALGEQAQPPTIVGRGSPLAWPESCLNSAQQPAGIR
jgi:hypothetical protein